MGAEESTDPLELFADAGYITDVVNRVKSGKEATVFCCRAHPSTGRELVAAKVYAIGIGAHYRMSKLYADGRFRVYKPDSRQERAIKSGKQRGKEMVFADWVGQEYANLCAFHAAGADVPAPIAQCGSGILMEYVGDAVRPAPTLVGADVAPQPRRNASSIRRCATSGSSWRRIAFTATSRRTTCSCGRTGS